MQILFKNTYFSKFDNIYLRKIKLYEDKYYQSPQHVVRYLDTGFIYSHYKGTNYFWNDQISNVKKR